MSYPRLEQLQGLSEGRVLIRLDLNVPVADGAVQDRSRIVAALPTVRWLLQRSPVVAACSHLGKAKGTPDAKFSLAPVATALAEELGHTVQFIADCIGAEVEQAVREAAPGTLLLLENLRFHPGEKGNDPEFARSLMAPFTHYVNDAFGTAHRAHASVAGIPAMVDVGRKAAGRLMEAELDSLGNLLTRPERPFTAVVGGAKISTKTAPLMALLERVDRLAVGGGMANTFMLAQGRAVGGSLVEVEMVATAREVLARAAARGVDLLMPSDVLVADAIDAPTRVEVVAADAVPAWALIVDLGPASRAHIENSIADAARVFWNGPMGIFEHEAFAAGTMSVASAMARCPGFTVVGGGESVMAIHRAGLGDRISHVSTGGGASLALIAGETLPGVAALEE